MDIRTHADHTEKTLNLRAEDIHKWIDGYFDSLGFQSFLQGQASPRFNPFSHRKHRHCREALQEALEEFQGKYTPREIEEVFFTHIRDDYDGYIPSRADFDNEDFLLKYHRNPQEDRLSQEPILSKEELSLYFSYKNEKKRHKPGQRGFLFRIVLPSLLTAALFIGFIFAVIVPTIENVLIDSKKEMIRELSQAAASVIHYYIDLEAQGNLSREEAQAEAVSELVKMRYGIMGKDYYWITDRQPVMIMHPYRPELVGQNLRDYRDREDKSGKFLFREAVALTTNQGEGYLRYQWQWMDDPDTSAEKMSFVMAIEPWGWILGTGVYIHDVQMELDEIQNHLMRVSLLLVTLILLMLALMILQSRRIENSRRKAERGLMEAKERYRSLVEKANEAYLLILDGSVVYSNLRMNQLLDLPGEEVRGLPLETILQNLEASDAKEDLLTILRDNGDPPAPFPARIGTSRGLSLMVTVTLSRMFFQDNSGYLLVLKEIPSMQESMLLGTEAVPTSQTVEDLIEEIRRSTTQSHALLCLQSIPPLLYGNRQLMEHPAQIRTEISRVFHVLEEQILAQTLQELGPPPCGFAFLNLGSNARGEITFYSDQDNALILDDRVQPPGAAAKEYFQEMTTRICRTLNQAGFPYCPGGIMAVNPRWSLPLSEWKAVIRGWIGEGSPQTLIFLNVVADTELLSGKENLLRELQDELFQALADNPEFLPRFARNTLSRHLPLNALGQLAPETIDGEKKVNLKECLKALEEGARTLALEHHLPQASTLERLEEAVSTHAALHRETLAELREAFDLLWKLRFRAQLSAHRNIQRVDDNLLIQDLNSAEKKALQRALNSIKVFQSALSFRYFGQG